MKRYVLLQCGHEFLEHGPDGLGESSPRVCSNWDHCVFDPGVEWMTDQGMAMSEVVAYTYVNKPDSEWGVVP